MEIRVLGCSGGRSPGQDLTSYLVDSTLLIDTGAVTATLSFPEQETITDVLITHAHLDHIVGLGFLYQNTLRTRVRPLDVYATEPVIRVIREHLLIPEIIALPGLEGGELPGINFHSIVLEVPFLLGPYEVEAFPVFHTPGSVGVRVSSDEYTMVFTGDTGRTDRIWRWIRERGAVDCLIAEVSFPNRMQELADLSRHLTPRGLAASLQKAGLGPDQRVYVVHLKPAFLHELLSELDEMREWDLIVARRGDTISLEQGENTDEIQSDLAERVRDKIPEFDRDADLYEQRDRLTRQFGVSAKAGEIIFSQGDKSRIMYIIQEGKVRIYRKASGVQKTLAIIGHGDFFGEMAMLNNRPRSATAAALTDVKLLAFDKAAFERLVVKNFGVALRIIRTLAHRLQEADTLIETLLYIDPHSKVINTIIQIAYDEGIETNEGFLVRTTPEKLSDRSGVVIGTLRGILADLVREKLLIARREAIVIPNINKLKRMLKFLELKNEFS